MEEMARSSHQGHSQSKRPSQLSLNKDVLDLNMVEEVETSVPSPIQSQDLKRKSDFEAENSPSIETSTSFGICH